MGFSDWRTRLGVAFAAVAVAVDTVHYVIFRDAAYLGKFVLAQLGFMPVSVFLVTVVINQLLGRREKAALLEKMNMVVGAFFIELGNDLLAAIAPRPAAGDRQALMPGPGWRAADFARARRAVEEMDFILDLTPGRLKDLGRMLRRRRGFILRLLANPNLLEHDRFTDLLWAVVHLDEELAKRRDLGGLSRADAEHLRGDAVRVTGLLVRQWLDYMAHLAGEYPYLYSLAVRTNPFDPHRRAEIDAPSRRVMT